MSLPPASGRRLLGPPPFAANNGPLDGDGLAGPPAEPAGGGVPWVGVVSGVGNVRGAWRGVLCESVWLPATLRTLSEPAAEEAAAE